MFLYVDPNMLLILCAHVAITVAEMEDIGDLAAAGEGDDESESDSVEDIFDFNINNFLLSCQESLRWKNLVQSFL